MKVKSIKMSGGSAPAKTGFAKGAIRKTAKQSGALSTARTAAAQGARKASSSKNPDTATSDS